VSAVAAGPDGRTRHYGAFYGVTPTEHGDDRPVLVVHGNCQVESLRVVIEASEAGYRCVRVPPVHELVAADLVHLHRLLGRCAVLVSQPVRADYRGLPLGTAQLALAAAHARLVVVPIVRDARLHPLQALVRVPGAGEPPVVPYHDVRTLARAAHIEDVDKKTVGTLLGDLFEHHAEKQLIQPTFITDYPIELSPLTKTLEGDDRFVDRFELFIGGMEIANAYSELNDPVDQLGRFQAQMDEREAGNDEAMLLDQDFITSLEHGFPPTGGEGIGIDRLVMLLTNSASIRDVILFPLMRPMKPQDSEETE